MIELENWVHDHYGDYFYDFYLPKREQEHASRKEKAMREYAQKLIDITLDKLFGV